MAETPRLLIDEPPLQVLPSLATAIGLNEAIFLQQLHYQLRLRQHLIDDVPWVYNTLDEWHSLFPFWAVSTIQRIIKRLEQLDLLVSANHNTNRQVQTRWYTINYTTLSTISVTISDGQNEISDGHFDHLGRSECPPEPGKMTDSFLPKTCFKEKTPPLPPSRGTEVEPSTDDFVLTPERLARLYNTHRPPGLPAVQTLSPARRKKARQALEICPDTLFWQKVMEEIRASPFLRGERPTEGHQSFRATFDWLLAKGKDSVENYVKVADGSYRDQTPAAGQRRLHV